MIVMEYAILRNNEVCPLWDIPVLPYDSFLDLNTGLVQDKRFHCVNYYGFPYFGKIKLMCCMADDEDHVILVSSAEIGSDASAMPSFTARHAAFEAFEREIHENFGMGYTDHPWLKPAQTFPKMGEGECMPHYGIARNRPGNQGTL